MSATVHDHRWVYLMIVVVGAALALGIAGVPATQSNPMIHVRASTTTLPPATPTGSG